ncbi:MAG TPA: nucleotidyltransferase family protein [Candidatus Xenobia bacterium]|jgi:NDP-sugar pyrophosphorylase family protein
MENVTGILLCGGKGERLKPLTDNLPKPLVQIRGKPLLQHLLEWLSHEGVRRFVACTGYRADAIEAFLTQHRWDVRCVNSGDADMVVRLRDARPLVSARSLVCYGDTVANVDLSALAAEHTRRSALATITVHPFYSPFGVVEYNGDQQVNCFREKPRLPYWINIGYLLLEPEAMDLLACATGMSGFLADLAATGRLFAYEHGGRHITVNTEMERLSAEAQIVEFITLMETHEDISHVTGLHAPDTHGAVKETS